MCGIAGIVTDRKLNLQEILGKLQDTLKNRGPDDKGIFSDSLNNSLYIAFVHTRLSIIDLTSAAHQPISNEDSSIYLVCNGEIYNYDILREELISRGHRFRSYSDNEVIIHLYEEKKENLLDDLRGMFAFTIWDKRNEKLFVARDRLGIKPLYYYCDNSIFIFASEIKAIINSGLISKEIDHEAITLYLKFGSIPSPKTIYKQIISLEPGHYLIFNYSIIQLFNYPITSNKLNRILDMLTPFSFKNVYLNYRAIFSNKEISWLIGKNFMNFDFTKYLTEDVFSINSLQEKISILEMSSYMADQLLKDSDVFGMCYSVEIRVPFIDHKLIEFVAKVPSKYKYKRIPNKYFLIKVIENLPQKIYQRPKRGFVLPLDVWMKCGLRASVEEGLRSSSVFDTFFTKKILRHFYDKKSHFSKVWSLFVLNKWLT